MPRFLTSGEIQLLKPVFRATLRYGSIVCDVNKDDIGGPGNSIAVSGVAHFSRFAYCEDFSVETADQWLFVHEMAHVWQWGHGIYPVWAALGIVLKEPGKPYTNAYPYDLEPGKRFAEYNIEQQASIVADYWALSTGNVTSGAKSLKNKNSKATAADYSDIIAELQRSGPPISKLEQTPKWP